MILLIAIGCDGVLDIFGCSGAIRVDVLFESVIRDIYLPQTFKNLSCTVVI